MRTILICHEGDLLDSDGLARWLASFSDLAGIVVLHERWERLRQRIRREIQRVGWVRFADVLAFRVYDRLVWAKRDKTWRETTLHRLQEAYPDVPARTAILRTHSPNSAEAIAFIGGLNAHIMIARCKSLLSKRVFTLPSKATLVMHPGICPEYRNAYGCFWALANRDLDHVGMTLLKVDQGIDTGAIYGYFRYDYDEVNESSTMIHGRVTFDNLPQIAERIKQIDAGTAEAIDVTGRPSATWGQPWLTRYLAWKREARRRRRNANR